MEYFGTPDPEMDPFDMLDDIDGLEDAFLWLGPDDDEEDEEEYRDDISEAWDFIDGR